MRKKKNNVYVGLDGLDIKVNTTKVLEQNYYIFYNNNNDETGHLQAVKDGYVLLNFNHSKDSTYTHITQQEGR